MTDLALYTAAVAFAKALLKGDTDWQEVQTALLNEDRFQPLFPSAEDGGLVSDEDGGVSMAIIRDAEDEIAEDSFDEQGSYEPECSYAHCTDPYCPYIHD